METHLSQETLQHLSKGLLTGDELVQALLHIESCDLCYKALPVPSKEQVIDIILGDATELAADRSEPDEPSLDDDHNGDPAGIAR